jgi:hypothetical protein
MNPPTVRQGQGGFIQAEENEDGLSCYKPPVHVPHTAIKANPRLPPDSGASTPTLDGLNSKDQGLNKV